MNEHPDELDRLVEGPVARVDSCTRAEYLERFRGREPFVITGGASHTAAVHRWDPEHLVARAGKARLELLSGVYEPEARPQGYPDAREVSTTLGEVIEALQHGNTQLGYLFNSPSTILRTNGERSEFHVGWGDAPNPGLAQIAGEFELPGFVLERDLIHAFLLLGAPDHAAPLHYDLGGEAKALVQVRGRKRVLLFPPSNAGYLAFPGWFEPPSRFHSPHVSRIDLHRPDFERFPDLRLARALETVLEPGDVLYWPPFWPHYVTNLDPFTLAISAAHEELGANCMLMRELIGITGRLFLELVENEGHGGPDLAGTLRLLQERVLADPYRRLETFYGWHGKVWKREP